MKTVEFLKGFKKKVMDLENPIIFATEQLQQVMTNVTSSFSVTNKQSKGEYMVNFTINGKRYSLQTFLYVTYRYVPHIEEVYEGMHDDLYAFLHEYENVVEVFWEKYKNHVDSMLQVHA